MSNYNLDRKEAEVIHPQNAAVTEEVAAPQNENGVVTPEDIENMSSEAFAEYFEQVRSGTDESQEDSAESEQNPSDGQTPASSPFRGGLEEQSEDAEDGNVPYKSFASKEEYEADRNSAVNDAFNARFKNVRQRDEQLKRIERSAKAFYPSAEDPIKAMLDDLDSQNAENYGQSVEDYRMTLKDRDDLERYREADKQAEAQKDNVERIIGQWNREAESLKEVVPDFSLADSMRNPAFAAAIQKGYSVAQAYMSMQSAAPKAPKRTERQEITQNAQSSNTGTGASTINPATMPTKDFMAYIERCRT